MTDLTALPALLARVEAATGGDREIDAEIASHFRYHPYGPLHWLDRSPEAVFAPTHAGWMRFTLPGEDTPRDTWRVPEFTTSLDATVALVELVRPKWDTLSGQNWAHFHSTEPARRAYFCNMSPRFKADGSLNDEDTFNVVGHGHTEVLARLAALLRSMIEEEGR